MSENFTQTVVVDFEYEVSDGNLPNPLCMVAHVLDENLRHVRTIKLWRGVEGKPLPPISVWRGEFGKEPPFDIGSNTLFIAYSAWAEMTCFKVLGWKFPVHIFDLHTAYLAASNVLLPYDPDEKRKKPRKRLPDACRAYGVEGWERIDKDVIAKDIGAGGWHDYGKKAVFDYCEEDVHMSVKLLRRLVLGKAKFLAADVARVLHWSNYSAKSIALSPAHQGRPAGRESAR